MEESAEEDLVFLKLQCRDCECGPNDCELFYWKQYPLGKEGCIRSVTPEVKDRFFFYMNEIKPFFYNASTRGKLDGRYYEIIDFLFDKIYPAPLTNKVGIRGKVLTT